MCSLHDAISAETLGVRTALLITEPFTRVRDTAAESLGQPGYPSVVLAHPISVRSPQELVTEVERVMPDILERLAPRA